MWFIILFLVFLAKSSTRICDPILINKESDPSTWYKSSTSLSKLYKETSREFNNLTINLDAWSVKSGIERAFSKHRSSPNYLSRTYFVISFAMLLVCVTTVLSFGSTRLVYKYSPKADFDDLFDPYISVKIVCRGIHEHGETKLRYTIKGPLKIIDAGEFKRWLIRKNKFLRKDGNSYLNARKDFLPTRQHIQVYQFSTRNALKHKSSSEMVREWARLRSFHSSRVSASPVKLSQSGFYATGQGDETQCYSCGMTYRNWQRWDKPEVIHRNQSPECPHLNQCDSRNVPVSSLNERKSKSVVYGIVGEYPVLSGSDSDGAAATPSGQTLHATNLQRTSLSYESALSDSSCKLDISQAVHPQFSDFDARLQSYREWSFSHVQEPKVLTVAGFYYAGYRDCVRCFYCGIGLRTWERQDDPWVMHALWRSSCDYVRCMRGEQFIADSLANNSTRQPEINRIPRSNTNSVNDSLITKATEMGFAEDLIADAMRDLLEERSSGRGSLEIPDVDFETLLEKLLAHEEPDTRSSNQEGIEKVPQVGAASSSDTRQLTGVDTGAGPENSTRTKGEVLPKSLKLIKEENKSLRDESICKMCRNNQSCIVFLPCGHLVTCSKCAGSMRNCLMCRARIKGTVRAYQA